MKVVVVTGGIGSGKSEACRYLHAKYGCPIFEADSRVKELYQTHPSLLTDIETAVGGRLCSEEGTFNPAMLSSIIFNDTDALHNVEALVFPVLMEDFQLWKKGCSDSRFGILESATIMEKPQLSGLGDFTLLIDAPVDTRLSRAVCRDGVSEDKIRQRMARQSLMNDISNTVVRPPVDMVIVNDGSVEELHEKLDILAESIV